MKTLRVCIELSDSEGPSVKWEQTMPHDDAGVAFVALGRAFEVLHVDSGMAIGPAVAAFMRGAMLAKGDVVEAMESEGGESGHR